MTKAKQSKRISAEERKKAEDFKARIVRVLDYFDEEQDVPWNFVLRTDDGKFEAMTTELFDDIRLVEGRTGQAIERSLGIFATCDAAVSAIRAHERRLHAAADRDALGKLMSTEPCTLVPQQQYVYLLSSYDEYGAENVVAMPRGRSSFLRWPPTRFFMPST